METVIISVDVLKCSSAPVLKCSGVVVVGVTARAVVVGVVVGVTAKAVVVGVMNSVVVGVCVMLSVFCAEPPVCCVTGGVTRGGRIIGHDLPSNAGTACLVENQSVSPADPTM